MQRFARSKAARWAAFWLTALLAAAFAGALAPASAHAQDAAHSPCIATVEQRAAYAADGTLDEREAFQESLGNDEPSPGLVQQALAREQAQNGIAPNAVPGDDGGMAAIGNAHVVALRVSFPDRPFAEEDTLEALQALIGPRAVGEAACRAPAAFPTRTCTTTTSARRTARLPSPAKRSTTRTSTSAISTRRTSGNCTRRRSTTSRHPASISRDSMRTATGASTPFCTSPAATPAGAASAGNERCSTSRRRVR
ncbi:MAG: hypothetical protein ACLR3C_11170 [Eggerthella lenta]